MEKLWELALWISCRVALIACDFAQFTAEDGLDQGEAQANRRIAFKWSVLSNSSFFLFVSCREEAGFCSLCS
jgi:hypothetical protein